MALKFAVKTLEEVPEAYRGEYVQDAELGFKLAIEPGSGGVEDTAELRRAHEREKADRKAAQKRIADMEAAQAAKDEELRKAALIAAEKTGDMEAFKKSFQEKYDKDLGEMSTKMKSEVDWRDAALRRRAEDEEAMKIAASICMPGTAEVLLPHIKKRLRADLHEGDYVTTVLDAQGKASAATLADLSKEFQANKMFAGLLLGSMASGGGSGGGKGGGATAVNGKPRSKWSTKEKSEYISEHGRQAYEALPMD
jgi:hypothetical protein